LAGYYLKGLVAGVAQTITRCMNSEVLTHRGYLFGGLSARLCGPLLGLLASIGMNRGERVHWLG